MDFWLNTAANVFCRPVEPRIPTYRFAALTHNGVWRRANLNLQSLG
jgi:hypothetical protein